MWIWASELHRVGFRHRSSHYWQCERQHGLPSIGYVSAFADGQEGDAHGRQRVDLPAFHVTFLIGTDRVHFYYHEAGLSAWEPGGHTTDMELRWHGVDPENLRTAADQIAGRLAEAMGTELLPRAADRT